MPDREKLEALFLANLEYIDRVLASLARRHSLSPDAADDAASWVKLKVVENDYAVLAKFRGESSITTYLTVVLASLFRDYRIHCWGRWRPSAEARRKGAVAVKLETLVHRDGLPFQQAAETIRSSGETSMSDRELASLLLSLPPRPPMRPVEADEEVVAVAQGTLRADDAVVRAELDQDREQASAAITAALERLEPEDRLIVQLRFWEGLSVADIARGLAVEQKPLYRRLQRLMDELRANLESAGFSSGRARELLSEEAS